MATQQQSGISGGQAGQLLRLIGGVVSGNGTIESGGGFRVDRASQGHYVINFDNPFMVKPAVCATQIFPDLPQDSNPGGGNPLDNAVLIFVGLDHFRIQVGDNNGNPQDRSFSFTASAWQ